MSTQSNLQKYLLLNIYIAKQYTNMFYKDKLSIRHSRKLTINTIHQNSAKVPSTYIQVRLHSAHRVNFLVPRFLSCLPLFHHYSLSGHDRLSLTSVVALTQFCMSHLMCGRKLLTLRYMIKTLPHTCLNSANITCPFGFDFIHQMNTCVGGS